MLNSRISIFVALVLGLNSLLLAGCATNGSSSEGLTGLQDTEGETAPDFSLIDVNPNSATHDQTVSPRGFLGGVSAWYFGHAT